MTTLGCMLWCMAHTTGAHADNKGLIGRSAMLDYTDKLIVKLREESPARYIIGAQAVPKTIRISNRIQSISISAGVTGLVYAREMSDGAQVVKLPAMLSLAEARELADRLSNDPAVEYAEPDLIMQPMAVPNDGYYGLQWHFHSSVSEKGAVNLPAAWDITTGDPAITVAIIDTGILPHADLSGRTVSGYDFISDILTANDGDGRDSDPTDAGDWITGDESTGIEAGGFFIGCPQSISTWHGTHIAGIIGAVSNNSIGVAGVNWGSRILPVRVLGKCGGYSSDIIDGMRWAAGLAVSGAPANDHPADILNLSFGAISSCTTTYQNTINEIVEEGKAVVVAAGNNAGDAINQVPANCNNVITVAANTRAGGLASYSNFGSAVDVTAPGGDFPLNPDGIASTVDQGETNALNDNSYSYYEGTSMAAPHVSGIASLMLSANYVLTGSRISPALLEQKIKATARTFPTGTASDCTTSTCGSGIIDAYAAVLAVVTAPVADAGPDETVKRNRAVTLDASNSSDDGSINNYSWLQTSGASVSLSNANTANPGFAAPDTADILTFQLTVTDDVGLTATDTVKITINADNEIPVASNGSLTMNEGAPGNDVLAATDADDDNLTYIIVSDGTKGTAVITNVATGAYTYTPDSGNSGNDSFTFKVNDGIADSNIATITVTINPVGDTLTVTSSSSSPGTSGGGGSTGPMWLFYAFISALWCRRRSSDIR